MKIYFWIIASISLTPLVNLLECYVYDDWEFLGFLMILIIGDTVLGIIKAWKMEIIHSKGFAQILYKLFAYSSVLILTHVLTHYKVSGEPNIFFLWFDDLAYAAMILREAISILENVGFIYPNAVPPWLLKRLKDINMTGKLGKNES